MTCSLVRCGNGLSLAMVNSSHMVTANDHTVLGHVYRSFGQKSSQYIAIARSNTRIGINLNDRPKRFCTSRVVRQFDPGMALLSRDRRSTRDRSKLWPPRVAPRGHRDLNHVITASREECWMYHDYARCRHWYVNDRTNLVATGAKSIKVRKDVTLYRLEVVCVSVTH